MTEAKLWKYENGCVFNRMGYLDQIQIYSKTVGTLYKEGRARLINVN